MFDLEIFLFLRWPTGVFSINPEKSKSNAFLDYSMSSLATIFRKGRSSIKLTNLFATFTKAMNFYSSFLYLTSNKGTFVINTNTANWAIY